MFNARKITLIISTFAMILTQTSATGFLKKAYHSVKYYATGNQTLDADKLGEAMEGVMAEHYDFQSPEKSTYLGDSGKFSENLTIVNIAPQNVSKVIEFLIYSKSKIRNLTLNCSSDDPTLFSKTLTLVQNPNESNSQDQSVKPMKKPYGVLDAISMIQNLSELSISGPLEETFVIALFETLSRMPITSLSLSGINSLGDLTIGPISQAFSEFKAIQKVYLSGGVSPVIAKKIADIAKLKQCNFVVKETAPQYQDPQGPIGFPEDQPRVEGGAATAGRQNEEGSGRIDEPSGN